LLKLRMYIDCLLKTSLPNDVNMVRSSILRILRPLGKTLAIVPIENEPLVEE